MTTAAIEGRLHQQDDVAVVVNGRDVEDIVDELKLTNNHHHNHSEAEEEEEEEEKENTTATTTTTTLS